MATIWLFVGNIVPLQRIIHKPRESKQQLCHNYYLFLPLPFHFSYAVRSIPLCIGDSYIQEVQHLSGQVGFVVWQQYDILLDTQPYDWWTMVDWANYVEAEELDSLDSLRIGAPGQEETELVHVYNQNKVGLKNFDRLKEEYGSLSIAGHSRTLNDREY